MKTILALLAVATVVAPPAFAASHRHAAQSISVHHPYAQSFEAGDYKFCMRATNGSPGCMFDSMEQCLADRLGKGGFCYGK
jgi:hypothetical protein